MEEIGVWGAVRELIPVAAIQEHGVSAVKYFDFSKESILVFMWHLLIFKYEQQQFFKKYNYVIQHWEAQVK